MATGAQTVAMMQKITRKGASSLDRLYRALREGDRGQLPLAKPGGGRNAAHLHVDHLVNYVLGLAADPVSEASEQVDTLSSLCCWLATSRQDEGKSVQRDALISWSRRTSSADRLMPGDTLGQALRGLVDWISLPAGRDLRSALAQDHGRLYLEIETEDGSLPNASIRLIEQDVAVRMPDGIPLSQYFIGPYPPTPTGQDLLDLEKRVAERLADAMATGRIRLPRVQYDCLQGSVVVKKRIPFQVLEAIADLWADTRAHIDPNEASKWRNRNDAAYWAAGV